MAINAENANLEFKESFDPNSPGRWCEIIKDIIAIANTGGGKIQIGINDLGQLVGNLHPDLDTLDSNKLCDKIKRYTGMYVPDLSYSKIEKSGKCFYEISIKEASTPIVFCNPGTYKVDEKNQKTAFAQGTLYFRHGAKSDTGNSKDVEDFIKKILEKHDSKLMKNLQMVIEAPPEHEVQIVSADLKQTNAKEAMAIRLTDDPNAPAFKKMDLDVMYPHRQKEIVEQVNGKIRSKITSFDIQSVRKVYKIDCDIKYCYFSRYSPKQFSNEFVSYLVSEYRKNPQYFVETRLKMKSLYENADEKRNN